MDSVLVPSQVSSVTQTVPRTVAAEYLPRVRNCPRSAATKPADHPGAEALASTGAEGATGSLAARVGAPADETQVGQARRSTFLGITNAPTSNTPDWVPPPASVAVMSMTRPRSASTVEPTGIRRARRSRA